MDRRRFLFAGLAATLGTALAPVAASASGVGAVGLPQGRPGDGPAEEDLLQQAQWGPPPGRGRRRRRCRVVQRRVAVRDRFGRVRYRLVTREVCR